MSLTMGVKNGSGKPSTTAVTEAADSRDVLSDGSLDVADAGGSRVAVYEADLRRTLCTLLHAAIDRAPETTTVFERIVAVISPVSPCMA